MEADTTSLAALALWFSNYVSLATRLSGQSLPHVSGV